MTTDKEEQEFLEVLDSVVRIIGDAIHESNVSLDRKERPSAVILNFLERLEMARVLAEHRLPNRWRVN